MCRQLSRNGSVQVDREGALVRREVEVDGPFRAADASAVHQDVDAAQQIDGGPRRTDHRVRVG
jgi:hypothetical protein